MPPIAAAGIMAAGSAASSGKSGKGSPPSGQVQTTGSNTPFSAGWITPGLNRANFLFNDPNSLSTFSGVGAPLSQDTQDWMTRMRGIASMPNNGAVTAGNSFLNNLIGGNFTSSMPGFSTLADTAAGKYLPGMTSLTMAPSTGGVTGTGGTLATSPGVSPGSISVGGSGNPFLDSLINVAANKAQGAVNSSFAGNERYGSGANANALTSNVMDSVSGILSPIYQQERNNQLQSAGILSGDQLQATSMAPSLEAAQFTAPMMQASALQGVGQIEDQRAQDQQNANMDALKNYLGIVGGSSVGGSTTSNQPYWSNPWAGILGSAMQGSGFKGFSSAFGGGDTTGGANTKGLFGANGLLGSYGPIFGSGEQFGPTSADIPAG